MNLKTPENWIKIRLDNIAQIISGGTPSTKNENYWNGEIYWATPTDIVDEEKYISNTNRKISNIGLKKSSAVLLPINSILMTSRATIGPRSINKVPMATNQGFKSFIPKPNKVNTEYLYYLIGILRNDFIKLSYGTTFLELPSNELKKYKVSLPPMKEQNKIADILSTWDNAIELKEKNYNKTQYKINSIKNKFFKYKYSEYNYKMKDLINDELKTKRKTSEGKEYGKYPFFTNSTVQYNKYLNEFDFSGEYIIANTGGQAYFDYYKGKFSTMSDNYVIKIKDEFITKYIYYALKRSENYINYQGFTGSGLKHLDRSWFRKFKLFLPSKEEQINVVNLLDTLNLKKNLLSKEIEQLKLQKKGLMQRLLTGKVRVQV